MIYDTHSHIDLYKNREKQYDYIENKKSYTVVMTNLPVLFEKYYGLYNNYEYLRFALGFHPQLVKNNINQLPIFIRNVKKTRYVGEIGLDYTNADLKEKSLMRQMLATIIDECSNYNDKILSVHSRKACDDVNKIIGKYEGKVILHWFTGSMKELYDAIDNGYYFSVNHNMANSKSGKKRISNIPIDRMLIESDAPFTRGLKTKYSLDFYNQIISLLSIELNLDEIYIQNQLFNNFKSLLNYKHI